ncbi:unnamed protein product, partial [Didymodactylos carnosus]
CEGVKQWETVNELITSAINNIDNRILLEFTENLNDSDNVFDDIQYIDSPEKAQDDGEDNGYDNVGICQGEIDIEKYIELIEPIYNPPSDNSINDSQNIRSTILQPLSAGLHKLIIIILFDGQHWLTLVNYKSARHFTVFDRHFTGFSRRLICMLSRAVNFTCYTYYRVELLPVKQCPIDKKTDIYFVLVYAVLVIKLYADKNKNKNKTDIANIKFNIQQLTDYFDNSFNKLIIDRLLLDVVSDTVNVPLCKHLLRNYVNLLLLNRRDTLNYKVHPADDDKLNHCFEFRIELICDCNLPFDDTVSACIYCDKQIHDSQSSKI